MIRFAQLARWAAILGLFLGSADSRLARAESDAAFTDYEKVVDMAFPSSVMERNYSRPSADEKEVLESLRSSMLQLIEGAGGNWLTPLTHPQKSTNLHKIRVREVLKKAPIWICRENCGYCPGNSKLGCAANKQLGDAVASILLFHSCLFQGKNACPASLFEGSRRVPPAQIVIEAMKKGLTTAAYAKLNGAPEGLEPQKQIAASVKVLDASTKIMNGLVNACPGPFTQSGFYFLKGSGHLKPLNEFIEACGQNLFEPLKKAALPQSCKQVIDPLRWNKTLVNEVLRYDLPVVRCDAFCEWATCGDRRSKVPRLFQFGSRWFLSVPEPACQGSKPEDPHAFMESLFTRFSRAGLLQSSEGTALLRSCLSQLDLSQPRTTPTKKLGGQPVELPEGPNIDLIEPSN